MYDNLPPVPEGFEVENNLPPLPAGFQLETAKKPMAPEIKEAGGSLEDWQNWFKDVSKPPPVKRGVREIDSTTGYRSLIRTPEDLAAAYGFKATDFDPKSLADEFEKYKSETGERTGSMGALGLGIRAGVQSPVTGGRQLLARAIGSESYKNIADLRARYSQDILANRTQGHGLAEGLGEVVGGIPYAAILPETKTLKAAAGVGALFGATAPVASPDFWKQKAINTTLSAVAAPALQAGMQGLVTGGTKAVAGARGVLPRESEAAQRSIIEALGVPKENVTAADILFRNGVRTNQSKITEFRNLVQQGSSRLANINEQNLVAADRAVSNFGMNVGRELEATPFSGLDQLRSAAQNGDKNAARILAELPSGNAPVGRGATEQSSLELEKWLREQNVTGPAYAAIPPEPSTSNINSSNFAQYLQDTIAALEGKGQSHPANRPGGPLDILKTIQKDYAGTPSATTVQAQPSYTSAQQKFIDEMLTNGVPQAKVNEILAANGITPTVAPAAQGAAGVQGMNDLKGLMTLRDNLKDHVAELAGQGGGNKFTQPLTQAIRILDEIVASGQQGADWQAHLGAKSAANKLFAENIPVYNESLVGGLLRRSGNMEEVLPDVAANQMLGMTPDKASVVMGAMEPRGQAAMRTNFVNDLLAKSRNPSAPEGLQLNRSAFLNKAEDPVFGRVLTPEQQNVKGRIEEALRLMDQMGSPQPSTSGAVDVATAGSSQYKMAKTIFSKIASSADKFLTTDAGKAMLLTLSATKDPALRGTLIQKILLFSEQNLPKQVGASALTNASNPVNIPDE